MSRLRRTDCSTPGLTRRGRGRGFEYVDERGAHIDDAETLERIRALVIPPAWRDVWISPIENGHLQAVGVDAAGRRQYLYHERWRARRDREKFARMLLFAKALPRLRRAVTRDLAGDELSHDQVLACAIRLLDVGLFRIGNQVYAEENGSYGLTTLERRHAELDGRDAVVFDYTAKGGLRRRQRIRDRDVRRVVAALKRRRGDAQLLAYQDRRGARWSQVRSEEINERIKELTGIDETSAKDFRTWHATVLAATSVASADAGSPRGRERVIREAVAEVAELLGNTPTVARTSYIDPQVFDRYRAGTTIRCVLERRPSRHRIERAVVDLLDGV
jgi:DNA topoisomerase IB